MRLGIVGHGAEKFTPATEAQARRAMYDAARAYQATTIISGHSPLGGVDLWAEELALVLNVSLIVHAPARQTWSGVRGYQDRNLKIAHDSDLVLCVVVADYPPHYTGMTFFRKGEYGRPFCYHCKDRNPEHVKSGGCWTAWKCPQHAWRIIGA